MPLPIFQPASLAALSSLPNTANAVISAIAGGLTTTSVKISAKMTDDSTVVRAVVSTDESGFTSPIYSSLATASNSSTGRWVQMQVTGLTPNTQYYYRVANGSNTDTSYTGKFKTPPTVAQITGGTTYTLKIAHWSCNEHNSNHATFTKIADKTPDLIIQNGDFGYPDTFLTNSSDRVNVTMRRDQWQTTLTLSNIKNLVKQAPFEYVWSDHDWGGDATRGSLSNKANVQQAFRHVFPTHTMPATSGSGSSASGAIYRDFYMGRVHIIYLDCRTDREDPGTSNDMIDATQEAWLISTVQQGITDGMKLTLIVSEVNWTGSVSFSGGDESWSRYPAQRARIVNSLRTATSPSVPEQVIFVTGDQHCNGADNWRSYRDATGASYPTTVGNGDFCTKNVFGASIARSGSDKSDHHSYGQTPLDSTSNGQYGFFTIVDNGTTLTATWNGYHVTNAGVETEQYDIDPIFTA
jgi:phosphodiesterase/alkaline phosphatase D-like protein